jgi:hypothetical protein
MTGFNLHYRNCQPTYHLGFPPHEEIFTKALLHLFRMLFSRRKLQFAVSSQISSYDCGSISPWELLLQSWEGLPLKAGMALFS